jgi:hypothetical protein
MSATDELVDQIVNCSHIPSGKRRQEIQRELRCHIEDFVLAARADGRDDLEIAKMAVANFGDPAQIAEAFAWVYRRERAVAHLSVFMLSSLAVTSMMLAAVVAVQAGIAFGLGTPVLNVVAGRHTVIEALDILCTVTTYAGLVALERLFERNRSLKALAVLALAFAVLMGICITLNFRAPFLVFGVVNGAFFRTIQMFIRSGLARNGIVLAGAALVGFISFESMPFRYQYALAVTCVSWLVMGAAYRQMPVAVARMNAALDRCLQRI